MTARLSGHALGLQTTRANSAKGSVESEWQWLGLSLQLGASSASRRPAGCCCDARRVLGRRMASLLGVLGSFACNPTASRCPLHA